MKTVILKKLAKQKINMAYFECNNVVPSPT